ncbi:hypothetical protein TNCV_131591 [Trichonephila clavipes]|nr:hypothetical protein TNCV_131591 [Trichonephila clavipes]
MYDKMYRKYSKALVVVVSFLLGRDESCQSLRQVGFLYSTPILRENTQGWPEATHLSPPSTNHTRGLAARRLFIVPPATKALYIYKHPCLLRDSNPGPTAQQSASLTTIPDG